MTYPEKLSLANLPTPIVLLPRLSSQIGTRLYIWRDDLTGFAESGNKIRKLEFLAADAVRKKAKTLVTCGGPQSNHARATAFIARRLGLDISLLVRKPKAGLEPDQEKVANYLLNRILGADIQLIEFETYLAHDAKYDWFLDEKADQLEKKGKAPYLIPEGGSTALGCFGYLTAIGEMLMTWQTVAADSRAPTSLFVALGSGGTYAGIHLGLEAHGLPSSLLHAVNVCDNACYFEKRVNALFDDVERSFGIRTISRTMQIHDGYVGKGYAQATDEELRFYADIAQKEGLLLDPCYTGKAFLGMIDQIRKDPGRFGKDVLFLHSGGGFGTFAYGDQYLRALI